MEYIIKFIVAIFGLILGIPIGNLIAKYTKEELKSGKIWFYLIISISLVGAIISVIFLKDVFLFSFLFIMIVVSRSLK